MKKLWPIFLLLSLLTWALPASALRTSTAGKFFVAHTSGSGCSSYATWDPSHKNSNITLSNGNLTAQGNNTGQGVRSTIGKSSGKWYWEYLWTGSGSAPRAGIANGTWAFGSLGGDVNSWGYLQDGNRDNNGSQSSYGSSWSTQTIGVALDMNAGTVTMYVNNVSQGTMYSGLTGTIYAAINTGAVTMTANFGATPLTYTPPSGFTAGLCN